MYQKKIAGGKGYPFKGEHYVGYVDYSKTKCFNAEEIRKINYI